MTRLVRDYIDISDAGTLGSLIAQLTALRERLPENAEVQLRGNDHVGRRISVAHMRPLTAEESACEARYADAATQSWARAA